MQAINFSIFGTHKKKRAITPMHRIVHSERIQRSISVCVTFVTMVLGSVEVVHTSNRYVAL